MVFREETPNEVCNILLQACYDYTTRLRLYYSLPETGECLMFEDGTLGYIGKSIQDGTPMLIPSMRSNGLPIRDHLIMKITMGKNTLYQHPLFHMPSVTVGITPETKHIVYIGNSEWGYCTTEKRAQRLALFMLGIRNSR